MHHAERLYLSGYLTYPRTESTKYPSTFNFRGVLNAVGNQSSYSEVANKLK